MIWPKRLKKLQIIITVKTGELKAVYDALKCI
jgi:hypothetical protein